MLKTTLTALASAGLIAGAGTFALNNTTPACCQKAKQTVAHPHPAPALRCSLTGKTVSTCCCVERQGKLHCTLADKDVEQCCCKPVDGGRAS